MRNSDANGNLPGWTEPTALTGAREDVPESLRHIIGKHFWTVLLPILLALAAGVLYLQSATPQYTSTSRIYVEQTGPTVLERDAAGVVTRWDSYLYTQVELLRSAEILAAALKSPALAQRRTFAEVSSPLVALRDGLKVAVSKKDDIITVSFTSPYPDEAADIVNVVVDAYIKSHNRRKSSLAGEAVKILGEERAKREKELNDKLQRLTEFELQNEDLVFGTDRDTNVIMRALGQLRLVLTDAEIAVLDSKAFYETCKRMMSEPSKLRNYVEAERNRGGFAVLDGQVARLEADLTRLERERADCLQRLRPDTPAIAALDAEIAQLQQQIRQLDQAFAAAQLAVAEEQLLAARERQKTLEAHFEQQRQKVVALSNQLAHYMLLQSDYQRTKNFCDTLDDRIRVLGVNPQVGGLNVEILEAAEVAALPSQPRVPKTMGLALSLGFFAGTGLALYRERRCKRLRSIEEISDLLELPILGAVPSITAPNQTPAIRGQKVRISPDSYEAEAFRSLRTAIFHRAPKGKVRTLLVTSAGANEGKSMVVGNLAIMMAFAGQRVVVVDANLRRPGQHVLFNLEPNGKGLSSVVAGKMSLDEALVRTKIENLSVLASGPAVSHPAEMIDGEGFAEVLKTLAQEYDRVLIDSPAVLPVTDAQILATRCDATVLVVRARASSRKASVQAYDRLASVDAPILGMILNDVRHTGEEYGYCPRNGHRREAKKNKRANRGVARDGVR